MPAVAMLRSVVPPSLRMATGTAHTKTGVGFMVDLFVCRQRRKLTAYAGGCNYVLDVFEVVIKKGGNFAY